MRWIVAGGGTGGHLYPGIAIAQELRQQIAGADVLFVGHGRGLTGDILKREGFDFKEIKVSPIKGSSIRGGLKTVFGLPPACWQAGRIINRFNPQAVVGVGGYSAGPVVLSAALMRKACYIQEQNVYPGLTNRLLGRWVKKIFISYQATADFFPLHKVLFTGNPLRMELKKLPLKAEALRTFGLSQTKFTVLVFGGSQGAKRINQGLLEALPLLAAEKENLQLIHQTGEPDYSKLKAAYEEQEVKAHIASFIYDMPSAYAAADMVICRAGATSLAELTMCGKPALLIPYPYAANDHQRKNAEVLAQAGAAKVMLDTEVSGAGLAWVVLEFMHNREQLAQMAEISQGLSRPNAARQIVEHILTELGNAGQN